MAAWKQCRQQTSRVHHAYWEWVLQAIGPTVSLTTPLGRFPISLLRPSDHHISTQCSHRVVNMLGAGCTLAGSRSSVRESQRSAQELLAAPMPPGVVEFTDPVDVICDLVATQGVPISNIPLATGVPVTFLEHCTQNLTGSAVTSVRTMWHAASRMGCTLTITAGQRTTILSPSTAPDRATMSAVITGYERRMASPSTLESDADRNALGPILAGEETVREAAARLGVSRQAVVQRLKRSEVTCTVLKSQARFIHARAVLRRALMSRA